MKTRNIMLTVLCCLFSIGITAQVIKEKKSVANFDNIAASCGIDVYYTQSSSYSVEIETTAENMKKIDVTVKNGSLELKCKKGERMTSKSSIKAYVTAPVLNNIAISGGSDFFAKDLTKSKKLSISASGGADLKVDNISADECNLVFSGGADCIIKKLKSTKLNAAFSGGSDCKIDNADIGNATLKASGGADIILSGKADTVSAAASGGGDINLRKLTCDKISSSKSGGGSVLQ